MPDPKRPKIGGLDNESITANQSENAGHQDLGRRPIVGVGQDNLGDFISNDWIDDEICIPKSDHMLGEIRLSRNIASTLASLHGLETLIPKHIHDFNRGKIPITIRHSTPRRSRKNGRGHAAKLIIAEGIHRRHREFLR
jgi:hypothetical protein